MRIFNSFITTITDQLDKLVFLVKNKLSQKQFLLVASAVVGLSAGLAAVVLKSFVHYIHKAITYNYNLPYQYIIYIFFPLIGILITVFYVQKYRGGKLGRGTANILQSIAKKSSVLPSDKMYSHVLTSGITVGLGGSAGLESPMVTTGSAIGSNFGRTYLVNYKDRTLLLASGAAAGIAAAFNAPIAGVLFALEVLLADMSLTSFIPLLIAAASGALCSNIILKEDILLQFHLKQFFNYQNVPFYILLGACAGVISVYYSRTFMKVESKLKKWHSKPYLKALIGGLILALLILLFPPLMGEGYDSIKLLAEQKPNLLLKNSVFENYAGDKWIVLAFVFVVMMVKVFATSLTLGSGGNGGNFAPSLFTGAFLGFFFSKLINLTGITSLPVTNFVVVGMCGFLAGVFHAPLTGIFLIAEVTGGYELMIPLMIVSAISFAVAKYFEPFSMDIKKLAKKGKIFTHDRDKNILSSIKVNKVLETDFQTLRPSQSLGEVIEVISKSKRNIFPVVDKDNILIGVILLDSIREIMFKTDLYDKLKANELMRLPKAVVTADEDMIKVMKKFENTQSWNLPVIGENNVYLGIVSKSTILNKYRSILIKSSSE